MAETEKIMEVDVIDPIVVQGTPSANGSRRAHPSNPSKEMGIDKVVGGT